jgi:calnexin
LDNEPEVVPDPDVAQPEDWDEEEDGEWEAPMVPVF